MQRDGADRDTLSADFIQQGFRKVQAGGRGGRAAQLAGIDGLVALAVLKLFLDVRGQGHFPQPVQHLEEDALIEKADAPVPVRQDLFDACAQLALAEEDLRAFAQVLARPAQAFPDVVSQVPQQHELADAAGRAAAQQAGGQDPRVVDDQAVTRLQQAGQLIEMPVLQGPGFLIQTHQARAVALGDRRLGDQLRRQVIGKIGCFHVLLSISFGIAGKQNSMSASLCQQTDRSCHQLWT